MRDSKRDTDVKNSKNEKNKQTKLKIMLLLNPEILLLGIYSEQTIIQRDTYMPVFIAALSTTART